MLIFICICYDIKNVGSTLSLLCCPVYSVAIPAASRCETKLDIVFEIASAKP